MTIKTLLIAASLIALPALSYAMCSEREHQAQSCAPGTVWDAAQETCVEQINS
ncbi:carbohydrate-binding module family 14 protein [Antarcticimicrobium luteum]|uniref:Adenylosuccinate lyase n=1 Tax=Antarcticimicrobium luteum TaxID=2547397 RepID=A0A4R5VFQ9_9RHOB|nr:carbohydrate-binding module family 14 protein [Antarcticimicrobium luteum]TDK51276.1 adenylosuccinate lyase [Antarcticimicrobium luteum]